jgi:hypothetical protein
MDARPRKIFGRLQSKRQPTNKDKITKIKLVMKLFNQVQLRRPKKSKFDLSHEVKMTLDMGKLYPILCHDVIPGDSFKVNTELLLRLQPQLAPVMHRINATVHYFYVPNRILYSEWQDFITGGQDGLQAPIAPHAFITNANKHWFKKKTLPNYLGIPNMENVATITNPIKYSLLPFAAYQKIYDDYYRDSTLQTAVFTPLPSGDLSSSHGYLLDLMHRNLERDYFTSAMPWAQRGPSVAVGMTPANQARLWDFQNDELYTPSAAETLGVNTAGGLVSAPTGTPTQLGMDPGSGIDIRELRRASRLQEWLEKNAVAGGRYLEQIMAHFGEHMGDASLQRSIYLGGGKQPIVFSEVLQTSGTDVSGTLTPLGEMGGHGISAGNNAGFTHKFKEHGYIIGLLSVLPVNTYQQGLPRHFSRTDKLEYAWPEFAQIGEQEIKNKEIYIAGTTEADEGTFGYQSRYSEMKYIPSRVCGDMEDSLDFWHLGRKFETAPALNDEFIKATIDKRIFAVTDPDEDSIIANIYHNISAIRPLPYFGTPTL